MIDKDDVIDLKTSTDEVERGRRNQIRLYELLFFVINADDLRWSIIQDLRLKDISL